MRCHLVGCGAASRTLESFLYAQSLGGLIHILKVRGGLTDNT
jgi:hypothetical protein